MLASTPFTSSVAVYDWISGFLNLERGQSGQNHRIYRLDRMHALAEMAGRPETCAPAIHVAGSKGKGSVTGMIAAILEASGIKTAKYASPHAYDFRERLCLGNNFFYEETYVRAGLELKDLVDSLPSLPGGGLFDPRNEHGEEPTFFELMTMWFFLCSRLSCSGAMSVETGMGGRLDTTNILDPLASVITIIELEHTEFLGTTIAAIAGEKAGIIKPGRPLILAEQSAEALEVFREQTSAKKSPLLYFPDCATIQNARVSKEGTGFTLALQNEILNDLFVPMPGEVQAYNAGLAILTVKTAFRDITEKSIQDGLAGFRIPARFERISERPVLIVDGAHTSRSMELCLKTFSTLYGTDGILVFGCAAGKDTRSMAELCVSCFSRIIITTPGTFKKSNPGEIYETFTLAAKANGSNADILFIPDTNEAVDTAINLALKDNLPVLGTGSFYLAGEIRNRLRH